ncbi:hypothetical protein V1514DRAFT_344600 [Lipomyces japonicus]|uniref:uncharacterized protein n=1 Tax=Lipomyces japonicus TaxID=56871 RepID=UPI0034CE9EC9
MVRTEAQLLRGRTISLAIGGIVGFYIGAKMLPYELVKRENTGPDGARLKMYTQETQPLELKRKYKDELYRHEIDELVQRLRADGKLDGKTEAEIKFEAEKRVAIRLGDADRVAALEQEQQRRAFLSASEASVQAWKMNKFGGHDDKQAVCFVRRYNPLTLTCFVPYSC